MTLSVEDVAWMRAYASADTRVRNAEADEEARIADLAYAQAEHAHAVRKTEEARRKRRELWEARPEGLGTND